MTPNILLVSLAPLRRDHLSCYGYAHDTTPFIDTMAREGALFTRAYSTSPWTPPAYASLLTGRYPSEHGVSGESQLSLRVPTLAELLSQAGYDTVCLNNDAFLGSYLQLERGFDTFLFKGYALGGRKETAFSHVRKRINKRYRGVSYLWVRAKTRLPGRVNVRRDKGGERITDMAIDWVNHRPNANRPFFMLLHYTEMHRPYSAPHPYTNRYLTNKDVNWAVVHEIQRNPFAYAGKTVIPSKADMDALKALYDAAIYYNDLQIGRLLNHLREINQLDNTLVIILSQHGENFGEHGLLVHSGSIHEPLVHIPIIMRYPARIPQGTVVSDFVQQTDFLPTLLHVAGADASQVALSGDALRLFAPDSAERRFAVTEWEGRVPPLLTQLDSPLTPKLVADFAVPQQMLRLGDFKYVTGREEQLFNVVQDPGELHNLAEQQPGRVKAMADQLAQWRTGLHVEESTPVPDSADPRLLTGLREGGYKL
jgi:arylsulfatase A-like enzyme